MFLFRFVGLFLFRFEEARFSVVLSKEPPRSTRPLSAGLFSDPSCTSCRTQCLPPTADLPADTIRFEQGKLSLPVLEQAQTRREP